MITERHILVCLDSLTQLSEKLFMSLGGLDKTGSKYVYSACLGYRPRGKCGHLSGSLPEGRQRLKEKILWGKWAKNWGSHVFAKRIDLSIIIILHTEPKLMKVHFLPPESWKTNERRPLCGWKLVLGYNKQFLLSNLELSPLLLASKVGCNFLSRDKMDGAGHGNGSPKLRKRAAERKGGESGDRIKFIRKTWVVV